MTNPPQDEFKQQVSLTIKALRTARRWNQKDFADAMEVSQSTASRWESGAMMPDAESLDKLADLTGFSVDQMLGREPIHTGPESIIEVRAAVQAGNWAPAIEMPETEWFSISVPDDTRLNTLDRQGFLVRGESMNKLFPSGRGLNRRVHIRREYRAWSWVDCHCSKTQHCW